MCICTQPHTFLKVQMAKGEGDRAIYCVAKTFLWSLYFKNHVLDSMLLKLK